MQISTWNVHISCSLAFFGLVSFLRDWWKG
uniref:Uncharacterized protein n=1 Tax=Tetranychus urticae TaxID=32264 RepID=T1L3S3_TETUR